MAGKARHKLSAVGVKALIHKGGPKAISDGAGLTLTISASGYAAWILRYRINGKRKEVTIGSYADFPLREAREAAVRIRRSLLNEQIDPARQKAAQNVYASSVMVKPETFIELGKIWYKRKVVPESKFHERVQATLNRWVYPKIGKLHPEDVTAAHIVECIEATIAGGSPTVANKVRRYIGKIMNYAARLQWIPTNPAVGINQEVAGYSERPRIRALSLTEIKVVLDTLESNIDSVGRDADLAIRLLLLLGLRKAELIRATWDEVDLEAATLTVPKEHSKTGNEFIVPLSVLAVEYLRELHILACGSEYVFPCVHRMSRNVPYMSDNRLNGTLARQEFGIDHFTIHDLRRTMRTQLSALGIRFEVAERCLNHKLRGMAGIYDRHEFMEERRVALEKWAAVLATLDSDGIEAANKAINSEKIAYLQAV